MPKKSYRVKTPTLEEMLHFHRFHMGEWSWRYMTDCMWDSKKEQENIMPMSKQRAKVIFKIEKSNARQPYHGTINSCNGRMTFSGENITNKSAVVKTINNHIEAIKLGQYKIIDCSDEKV